MPSAPLWQETGPLTGIDHAVAITSNPQENIAFYEGVLGLELCRNSSSECPGHGHLSYRQPGTEGRPFLHFIVNDAAKRAETGTGPVKRLNMPVATYDVFEDSYHYWGDRLDAAGVSFEGNFDNPMLWFEDPEGLRLRIMISYGTADPEGPIEFKPGEPVPPKYQLTGINGIELETPDRSASAFFMRHAFGCSVHDQRDVWYSKLIFNFCGGAFVHWRNPGVRSTGEAGSVHHVALRSPADELETLHGRLQRAGVPVEPVGDHPEIGTRCFLLTEPGGALLGVSAPRS